MQHHSIVATSFLIFFTVAFSQEGASEERKKAINDWVAPYVKEGENLLCVREIDGEYFFLARAGSRVKVGSRLDMTEYQGVHSFIIAWMFRNEKGGYLATNVQPTTVKEGYVRSDSRSYAERVQYQVLNFSGSKQMRVTIDIKKCAIAECDRRETKSKTEKQYTVRLCEVPLVE